jgi:hypothetical protein
LGADVLGDEIERNWADLAVVERRKTLRHRQIPSVNSSREKQIPRGARDDNDLRIAKLRISSKTSLQSQGLT